LTIFITALDRRKIVLTTSQLKQGLLNLLLLLHTNVFLWQEKMALLIFWSVRKVSTFM